MESGKIRQLEEKYWAGQTDAVEEEQLRQFALSGKEGLSPEITTLMNASHSFSTRTTSGKFEEEFWNRVENQHKSNGKVLTLFQMPVFWKIAASFAIIAVLGIAIYSLSVRQMPETAITEAEDTYHDTYTDPRQAYEETKRALLMVSSKLNEAEQPVRELKRFHESKISIAGSPATDTNE